MIMRLGLLIALVALAHWTAPATARAAGSFEESGAPAVLASAIDPNPVGADEDPGFDPATGTSGVALRAPADSFPTPGPRALSALRRTHRPSDWLLVTMPSGRHRLRAGYIGPEGLLALEAWRPPGPAEIAWKDIALIERRNAYSGTGRSLGILAGGAGGLGIGTAAGEGGGGLVGFIAGAILGGVVGSGLGDRVFRVTPLYDAKSAAEAPAASDFLADEVTPVTDASRAEWKADYFRVAQSVRPADVLRVGGDFGWITGRVSRIDSRGLHGIERDPRYDLGLGTVPDPIPWSSVTSIDRRGSGAGKGALIGGLILGVALGAAGGGLAESFGDDGGQGFVVGFVLGGAVGAGVGALIGATGSQWHPVPGAAPSPSVR